MGQASSSVVRSTTLSESTGPPRQFTVRCEGRWRVRSAPSLNSKVIGSIAHGTIVFGEDEFPPGAPRSVEIPNPLPEGVSEACVKSLNCLWVRVRTMEAKEVGGVSEIKHDTASGGAMFCLRRNALGYGLYETDIEPLDGALLLLPDDLASDLRGDAQRTNVERNEDVSLTWKILGAAENISKFFSSPETSDTVSGSSGELRAPLRKRPEELFEVKQRELLKKAARSLAYATTKLISSVGDRLGQKDGTDLTAILPKDARSRYARLRAALAAAAAAMPGTDESVPNTAAEAQQGQEGSRADLQCFAEHCSRIERTGGWPELKHEVRLEIISFDKSHYGDLQPSTAAINQFVANGARQGTSQPSSPSHAGVGKSSPAQAPNGPLENMLGEPTSPQQQISAGTSPTSAAKSSPVSKGFGGMCPLLPPPPPPSNGVSAARLI